MSYDAIVADYIRNLRPLARAELDSFANQATVSTAVSLAARAVDRQGKRLSHQCRIPQSAIDEAHQRLMRELPSLRQCCRFADLHDLVDRLVRPIYKIGELYVYDTALRIGAKLELLPTEVYVHAGVRGGARRLGFKGSRNTIAVRELPSTFHKLAPYEIEDVLCSYKDVLGFAGSRPTSCYRARVDRPICLIPSTRAGHLRPSACSRPSGMFGPAHS